MSNIVTPPTLPGQIILTGSDGSTTSEDRPALVFTAEEAKILRAHKKLLQKYRWQTIYRCSVCQQGPNGQVGWVDGGVLDDKIMFACGHQQVVYMGITY